MYPVKWVRAERFEQLTGWPLAMVKEYRKRGVWPDGKITKVVGRRIHVNLPAYDEWVSKEAA